MIQPWGRQYGDSYTVCTIMKETNADTTMIFISLREREREREHDDTSMFSTTWKETDVHTTMIFTTESGNTHHYKHRFIILTVSK